MFAASPGVTIDVISHYDDKGPAWYWNTLRFGEHTGTHFDAPVHWITGKDLPDNACDTIPPRRFVGPACVIDVTRDVEADADFLLTPGSHRGVGERARPDSGGRVGAAAHRLEQADRSRLRSSTCAPTDRTARASTRTPRGCWRTIATCSASASRRSARTPGQAGTFDPPFPNHTIMHGAGKFGLASLCNLDQLPPTGAVVIAAPLKIVNGSGSPLRVLAIAPVTECHYDSCRSSRIRGSRELGADPRARAIAAISAGRVNPDVRGSRLIRVIRESGQSAVDFVLADDRVVALGSGGDDRGADAGHLFEPRDVACAPPPAADRTSRTPAVGVVQPGIDS